MGHQSKFGEFKVGMDQNLELNNRNYYFFSYSASLVIHIIILLICFIMLRKGDEGYEGKAITVQLMQGGGNLTNRDEIIKGMINNPESKIAPENKPDKEGISNKEPNIQNNSAPPANAEAKSVSIRGYSNFAGPGNDTSGLEQVYSENTLNVKIKYPVGWTFVDQDRHNKLDGVTFWASNGIFNPPPYIFLEVKEKYLFNPSRFKFNTKLANSVAYYNDPEELEGQVSQVFYIRTDTDEDYSIKLIMTGKDTFIAFQPIFFSMIKSFNFGKSLF
jgi:hypothetical protein